MQSAKIDFLSKYNDLVNSALTSAKEFPDNLCDFLVKEYEFEAVVLTAKVSDNEFEILGKSSQSRKSYSSDSFLKCNVCNQTNNDSTETRFEFDHISLCVITDSFFKSCIISNSIIFLY